MYLRWTRDGLDLWPTHTVQHSSPSSGWELIFLLLTHRGGVGWANRRPWPRRVVGRRHRISFVPTWKSGTIEMELRRSSLPEWSCSLTP